MLIHGVLDSEIGIAAQELEEGRFTDHISTTSWRNDVDDSVEKIDRVSQYTCRSDFR